MNMAEIFLWCQFEIFFSTESCLWGEKPSKGCSGVRYKEGVRGRGGGRPKPLRHLLVNKK